MPFNGKETKAEKEKNKKKVADIVAERVKE
jgi:hypothetical protein